MVEIRGGQVSRIRPDGTRDVYAHTGGGPNGSQFDPQGRLVVCNNGGFRGAEPGRIERIELDGTVRVLLSSVDGEPLHHPNDLGFDPYGNFYFTDPLWPRRGQSPADSPPGHVCFCDVDGQARRIHTGLRFPNGIGVGEGGDLLLVCETGTGRIHALEIRAPGEVGPPRVFADLGPDGAPDGFALDAEGYVLCCGYGTGRIHVFSPSGGTPIQQIAFDDSDVTNVCFGGPERRTLYVTESGRGRLVALPWQRPGMTLFPDRY